jgi:hypothetical protein
MELPLDVREQDIVGGHYQTSEPEHAHEVLGLGVAYETPCQQEDGHEEQTAAGRWRSCEGCYD